MAFGNSAWFCTFAPGELAEWSIAAVLKTVELLKVPGVRIPNSPQKPGSILCRAFFMAFYVYVLKSLNHEGHYIGSYEDMSVPLHTILEKFVLQKLTSLCIKSSRQTHTKIS